MKKLTKQSPITLVELPPTQFGKLNGELGFDVYTQFKLPLRALHVLQGVLKNDGWQNTQTMNPIYHGIGGKLTSKNLERIFNSDILMISSITRTSPQSLELARLYKEKNPNGRVIAGGPDPTFRLEDWLETVDIVVMGEGERTISELMGRLYQDPESLNDVDGIAFQEGGGIQVNNPRKLMTAEELSQLPHPFYDSSMFRKVGTGIIETSRGCPNDCDFCSVTEFYGKKYRTKSVEYVIQELERTRNLGRLNFISDDNLAGSPRKTIEILEAIAENGLNKHGAVAQVTVQVAKNAKLMSAMRNARINAVCIGIESINNQSLEGLGKPYTAEQNKEAVEIFREYSLWRHGMIMPGGDGDTLESLKEDAHWINGNLDSVQLFPPTALPGTRFYRRMKEEGRILTEDLSLYDGQCVVVRPKHISPYDLQRKIIEGYKDFYSVKNSAKRLIKYPNKGLASSILLYNHIFRGLQRTLNSPQTRAHLKFLKSIS